MYENTSERPSLWFELLPLSQAGLLDLVIVCVPLIVTAPQIELAERAYTTERSIALSAVSGR